MQHFGALRAASVSALVHSHPARASNVLVWAAGSETLAMGVRLEALEALVDGAYGLSGLDRARGKGGGATLSSTDLSVGDGNSAVVESNSVRQTSSSSDRGGAASKTVVKRPLRLAAMQREKQRKSFQNSFGDHALQFFQPILVILTAQLAKLDALLENRAGGSGGGDGLDVLLPSQCLLSLGAFVRCALHTPVQRQMLQALLGVAFPRRNHSSLHLRRAVSAVLLDCVDSLFSSLRVQSPGGRGGSAVASQEQFGTLGFLLHMAPPRELLEEGGGLSSSSRSSESFSGLPPALRELVTSGIQWAAGSLQEEPDTHCKVLKVEIVRVAVTFFE